jgi:hypothetical protein
MWTPLVAPIRIVHVPQGSVPSRRHMTQSYFTGDAITGVLRELPPHLVLLSDVDAPLASVGHVVQVFRAVCQLHN